MSDYLPHDALVEILSRLPVKTLLRSTSVCKRWYSLITNPNFISAHLNRAISNTNTHNNHLLFVRHYNMFQEINRYALHFDNEAFDVYMELECPFTAVNDYFRIVGVCNGLICLSDDFETHTGTVIIWNPCIRKSVSLPQPGLRFVSQGMCVHGFGFDSLNDDYKVVRVVYEAENHIYQVPPSVEIYSVNTGAWRSISATVTATQYVLHAFFTLPTFLNGAVHWVASNWAKGSSFRSVIVGFDMGEEVFREMRLPVSLDGTEVLKLSLSVRGTSLALTQYQKIWQSECCWVWVMEEYGVVQSWTKLFTIDLTDGIRTFMGFRTNNDVLLSARVRGLVSYDPKIKQIKYLGIHGTNRSFYADSYVESLVLLKGENRVVGSANANNVVSNTVANLSLREVDGGAEQQ